MAASNNPPKKNHQAANNQSSNQAANNNQNSNRIPGCATPQQIFAISSSLSILLYQNLTNIEVQTIINLLTMIVNNLSNMIDQQQLCEGEIVTPQTIVPPASISPVSTDASEEDEL